MGNSNLHPELIGKRFGFLTVLEYVPAPKTGGKHPSVICKCDCGNIKQIRLQHLRGRVNGEGRFGRTISCGCKKQSSSELLIEAILYENNINYQTQYRIEDDDIKKQPFDFAIFNDDGTIKCLLEYDGEQHYKPIGVWGGEAGLALTQARDAHKNNYCEKHNLKLVRIPYTDVLKLSWEYLVEKIPELGKVG